MNTGWSSGPKTYLFRSALISAASRIPGLENDAPFPRLQPAPKRAIGGFFAPLGAFSRRWGLFRAVGDFFAAISRIGFCAVKFSTISVLNLGRTKFVRSAYEFSTLGVRI